MQRIKFDLQNQSFDMKKKDVKADLPGRETGEEEKGDFPGYPVYPPAEDIYSKYHEEKDINPEDVTKIKETTEKENLGTANVKDFEDDVSGGDLDIPGTELDDEQENVGSEDEENDYYSLGGDDHHELEEDHGE